MSSYWEILKSSALGQSGLIAGLCLAAYWLGPISVWETNDDVYYNLVFAGKLLTSAPDPHVVMVNFVLSSLFSELYTLAPNVPWYGYFHVAAILLSVLFLNYCYGLTQANDKYIVRIAISLATALPVLFLLQFTKTAAVLAVAGYLGLYLLNQINFSSLRQNLLLHACASSFLVLSFALRKESFLLMTFLCGLLVASALIKRKKALILSLSTVIILIFGITLTHWANYGPEWEDFKSIRRAAGPIIDFNQYDYNVNKKVYADAGLSANDYNFFRSWGYSDNQVYNPERLDYVLTNATKTARARNPLRALQNAVAFPALNYILTAAGLIALLLLVYRQRYRLVSLYVFLPVLICTGILASQGRFPTRVSTPIVFFVPWAVLILCGETRKRLFVGITSIVVLVALSVPIYRQYADLRHISQYRQVQNQDLRKLGTSLSDIPIVMVTLGAAFPYEGLLPFESPSFLSNARFVWLCGMNQTPVQRKQLSENRVDDLFDSLSKGTSTYIVLKPYVIRTLIQYIYEHHEKNVSVLPVYRAKSFTVYRVAS